MTLSRPGERGGLQWLLVLALISSFIALSDAHDSGVHNMLYCQPWICACYMDGIYYDPGQTWQKAGEPCITYKCLEDGSYRPDTIGVMFTDGTCKGVNETWSVGCFKYKVEYNGLEAKYRLVEGGCRAENGNCLLVGDRIIQNCDTYECQIDGTCYTLKKVITGCASSSHGCRRLHSVWNDHCAVYQCVPSDLGSTVKLHEHDVMLWPRGYYGLLKPETGCPKHEEEKWDEGERIHYSEGENYYSDEFHMDGNHTELFMEHRFCTHEDYQREGFMPIYQTYWDEGRYCILRYNGSCPKGFEEGFVKMIDFVGNMTLPPEIELEVASEFNGTLPDGEFWENSTTLQFCCRYDGEIDIPLILPTNKPFVLFMADNETTCQPVRAMEFDIEYFSFADADEGMDRQLNGSLPSITTSDNNTLIYLCHYKPLTCGCVYEDGEYVSVGEVFVTPNGCVEYKCVYQEEIKKNVFILVKGGCESGDGKCIPVDSAIPYQSGESCYEKKCAQKTNPDKAVFREYWEFDRIPIGCKEDSNCIPLNTTVNNGCYTTKCMIDPDDDEPKLMLIEPGCSHGDTCIDAGSNVTTDECVTLTCKVFPELTKTDLVVTEGGCLFDGKCHPVGGVWQHECTDYICEEIQVGGETKFKERVIKLYCTDKHGACHETNSIIRQGCWDYKCYVYNQNPKFYVNGGDCLHVGKCRKHNEIWSVGCTNFTCEVFKNSTYFRTAVKYVNPACKLSNGNCIAVGTNVTRGCTVYQCRKGSEECGLIPIDGSCTAYDGSCIPVGGKWNYSCSTYECKKYDDGLKLENTKPGCKQGNKCYDAGATWNDTCKQYECREVNGIYKPYIFAKGCQDGKGGCMANGTVVTSNCVTRQCIASSYSCGVKIVLVKCPYNGKCIESGQITPSKTNKCQNMQCIITKTSSKYSISIKSHVPSKKCLYKNKCYEKNRQINSFEGFFCFKILCNSNAEMSDLGRGCAAGDQCIEPGSPTEYTTEALYNGQRLRGTRCRCQANATPMCSSLTAI